MASKLGSSPGPFAPHIERQVTMSAKGEKYKSKSAMKKHESMESPAKKKAEKKK